MGRRKTHRGRKKRFPSSPEMERMGRVALWAARKVTRVKDGRGSWPEGTERDDMVQETALITLRRLARWRPGGGMSLWEYSLFLARLALLEVLRNERCRRKRSSDAFDRTGLVRLRLPGDRWKEAA
ncbi:MAG: hypothetical protein N3A38_06255 [Planctomycetota bacterium]|nr:hypothetical protein [Planctomycetota bacterium]